jgi:DegV family protein with EDD domain
VTIALVSDSTADLTEADKLRYAVNAVPLHVSVGGTEYLDRVELASADFFKRFRETGQVARSSQPSAGEFERVYTALLEDHDAVISVHIAGKLSGTVQSATVAATKLGADRVRVVDSRQVSVGLGLVVKAAGEAIRSGAGLDEVVAATEAAARDTRVYSALPSLDAAVRGGRTSARTARIAGLIELKPLIVFDEEGGVQTDGVRLGYSRALRAVADRVAKYAAGRPVEVAITHADGRSSAEGVCKRIVSLLGPLEIPILEAGAVITTHVGLGTVAVGARHVEGAPSGPVS